MSLKSFLSGVLRAFNRRYEHSKILNRVNRRQRRKIRRANGRVVRKGYNDFITYTTSRLRIKRETSLDSAIARQYKRTFKGGSGWSWAELDRMSRQPGGLSKVFGMQTA